MNEVDLRKLGWVETSIDSITLPVEKISLNEFPNRRIKYVDISSIDNSNLKVKTAKNYLVKDAPSRARQIIQTDDVIFSTVRPYLKNIAQVPSQLNNEIASTGFSILRPSTGLDSKYLYYFCTNQEFVNSLSADQYGVSYPAVKDSQVRGKLIPFPPLNEQQRIASKLEELFSKLENGIESLKTAQQQLKVYRQSVLKHAFEGKLTEQWRKNNPNKLESAEQLLERIQREREARYNQQLKDWKGAVKTWEDNAKVEKKPSKPKLLKNFTAFSDFELKKLPLVPKTWFWGKLGNVTTGVEYGTSSKSSKTGEIPVVRMGNIQNGRIDWTDLVYTSDSEEINKYILKKGDILFNRTNSPELVGKTAKYMGEKPALFAGYLIRVNQICTIVLSDYLSHFLNSYTAKQHGNSVKTDGVNQSNINGEKLQNYPFPFTSLSEQLKIVEILEEKLSLTDKSIVDVGRQLAKSEALRQSILKKAFSGQLLQQDPNDEPASELLNRIAKEKAEIEAQIKVTKTAAKKAKSKTSSK